MSKYDEAICQRLGLEYGMFNDVLPIFKFGDNADVDTTPELIWSHGGIYTYPTVAAPLYISSDDNTDTQPIQVQGLDADWLTQTKTQNLVGQTKTLITGLSTTWIRCWRASNESLNFVSGGTPLVGKVYIYEDDTTNAGVPNNQSKIKAVIDPGEDQTLMATYSVPADWTEAYLWRWYYSLLRISGSSALAAQAKLQIRTFGGVFKTQRKLGTTNLGDSTPEEELFQLCTPKSDIRILGSSAGNASMGGGFDMLQVTF